MLPKLGFKSKMFFGLGVLTASLLVLPFFGLVTQWAVAASDTVNISGLIESVGECFLAGTKILLADGTSKNIEQLKTGERIMSFNQQTGHTEANTISKRFVSYNVDRYLVINGRLKVTTVHPLFLNGNWQEASLAKPGDELLNSNGQSERIVSIQLISGPVTVYNLEVDKNHNFFAENILVHNKGEICVQVCNTGQCTQEADGNYYNHVICSGCFYSDTRYSCTPPAPVANFIAALPGTTNEIAVPYTGESPLTLDFLDRSTGGPTTWLWQFYAQNGAEITNLRGNTQNISRTLTNTNVASQTYTIRLTVSNAQGTKTASKPITIYSNRAPIAVIDANRSQVQVSNTPNPPVDCNNFDDPTLLRVSWVKQTSGGLPDTFTWQFGDGQTQTIDYSNSPNGLTCHRYSTTGRKTVRLTVTNQAGQNSANYSFDVVTSISCRAGFDVYLDNNSTNDRTVTVANGSTVDAPANLDIINTSAGQGNLTYKWTITDNTSKTSQTFTSEDLLDHLLDNITAANHGYGITLTTTCSGAKNPSSFSFNFTLRPRLLVADFACMIGGVEVLNCTYPSPLTINFKDRTTGSTPSTWQWTLTPKTNLNTQLTTCNSLKPSKGAKTSTIQNPTCTFSGSPGAWWSADLRASNSRGYSFVTKTVQVGSPPPPNPLFVPDREVVYTGSEVTLTNNSTNLDFATSCRWCYDWDQTNNRCKVLEVVDQACQVQDTIAHTYEVNPQRPTQVYDAFPRLTYVDTNNGQNRETYYQRSLRIFPFPPPTAKFSCQPTGGVAPLSVNLVDQSTNTPTSWIWTVTLSDGSLAKYYTRNPTITLTPINKFTYPVSLKACNANGCTEAGVSECVTVRPKPQVSLQVTSPTPPLISRGQSAVLSWASRQASRVTFNQGLGSFNTNNFAQDSGQVTVSPLQTTTYTVTAYNQEGDASDPATVTVTVDSTLDVTLTANPALIAAGQISTLSWTSSNAESLVLNNQIGAVSLPGGSLQVSPSQTTVYQITATNAQGQTATAQATVTVEQNLPEIYPPPPPPPPTIIDIIPPPIKEFIQKILENPVITKIREIIISPIVQQVNKRVVVPFAVTASAIAVTTSFSLLDLLAFLRYIFTEPFFILFRKRKSGWGTVYNTFTKRPIDLAVVRIYRSSDKKLIATRVTNTLGQYFLLVDPGHYYLEVTKQNFVFPSTVLFGKKQDEKFSDLYTGGQVEITEQQPTINFNIPLDPHLPELSDSKIIRHHYIQLLRLTLTSLGPLVAIISWLVTPTRLLFYLVIVHFIFYALFRRLSYPVRPRSWGVIFDKIRSAPLATAVARVYEPNYHRLLEAQVTDRKGRYGFLVGNNIYYVTAQKSGYKTSQSELLDLRQQKVGLIKMDLGLELETTGAKLEGEKQKSALAWATTSELGKVSERVEQVKRQATNVQYRVGKVERRVRKLKGEVKNNGKVKEPKVNGIIELPGEVKTKINAAPVVSHQSSANQPAPSAPLPIAPSTNLPTPPTPPPPNSDNSAVKPPQNPPENIAG